MRSMRLFLLLGCVNALSFVPNIGLADAEEDIASSRHRDRAALSDIFEERVLQDNFAAICESVKALPAERRYHSLANWVLPDSHRSAFRLPMSFQSPATDSGNSLSDSESQLPPVSAVIVVKSPAIDLVLAASESGKLSELHDRVMSILPDDPVDQRCRETLLILMDIEGVNFESARKRLADVLAGLQKLNRNQLAMRCPETLAAYQGMQHDTTRDISAEILSFLLDSLVRVDRISSTDPCDRAIASLAGWAQAQNVAKSQTQKNGQSQIRLTQWSPVSRITHRTLGSGFPAAHWAGTRGGVNNVSSHDEDYLYFQSPLLGDFEVECDVTSVQWQHSHLMVCGNWIAPVRGRSEVEVGNFQRLLENVVIDPPLSPLEDWIHYRTVVRQGARSTFINGRLVDEQPLPKDHDPWLAIRSPWYADGGVRNLRITGQPEIPATVSLAPQPGLDQWIPGFDAVIGHDWLQVSDPGGVQIVGVKRNSQSSNTFCESVLQYHRPMLEDGTIEYEFLYEEDRSHVHPSLDGLAFLFLPDGVSLHQMTNGVYDRTTADPTTIEIEPATRRGPQHLPLKPMAWNQVQLKLSGNLVQLSLNGQVVLERTLEPSNLRRFGLFHFADQTQATVRNIKWSGSWPRTLPLESEQELADPEQPFPELSGAHVF
ncbi:MAG: DUF1583 domain-containing protein, partial [Fuerstia sp.]|nr:DUF1583 domain-containing protein [Fuerstiella sp.]